MKTYKLLFAIVILISVSVLRINAQYRFLTSKEISMDYNKTTESWDVISEKEEYSYIDVDKSFTRIKRTIAGEEKYVSYRIIESELDKEKNVIEFATSNINGHKYIVRLRIDERDILIYSNFGEGLHVMRYPIVDSFD